MNSSKEVIDLIMKAADERKITLSELAERVGVAKSSLSRYKSGDRDFPINDVGKYASVLGVSVEYLLGLEGNNEPANKYHYMPTTISAGLPINIDGITNADKISIPDAMMGKWAGHSDILFTRISGDSMNKIMSDGSLIAIKRVDNIESLKDGDMVVFSHNHEYSVKYFYKADDKLIFKPDSTNKAHHEQHFNINDGIQIHGKVVLYIVELD